MQAALAGLIEQGLVELTWLSGQTYRDLQRAMRQPQPWHIFHFIGHSDFDARNDEGVVALANEAGKTHLVQASDFRLLLADQHALRLVILNSCKGGLGSQLDLFSSVATTLVRRGLPAVLAMQADISDEAAEFTRAFYEALADGLPVDGAVAEARKAIRLGIAHTLEWGTPVLYLRAPDGVLFQVSEAAPTEPVVVTARAAFAPAAASVQEAQPALPADPLPPPPATPPANDAPPQTILPMRQEQPARQLVTPQKTKEQWVKEGKTHWYAQRFAEALSAYERALELDPTDAIAWNGKGNALKALGRTTEAEQARDSGHLTCARR